jgi:hypothetical protein
MPPSRMTRAGNVGHPKSRPGFETEPGILVDVSPVRDFIDDADVRRAVTVDQLH